MTAPKRRTSVRALLAAFGIEPTVTVRRDASGPTVSVAVGPRRARDLPAGLSRLLAGPLETLAAMGEDE